MSKTKVHVLVPYGLDSACGIHLPYRNGGARSAITCQACKKTQHFKDLEPGLNPRKKR